MSVSEKSNNYVRNTVIAGGLAMLLSGCATVGNLSIKGDYIQSIDFVNKQERDKSKRVTHLQTKCMDIPNFDFKKAYIEVTLNSGKKVRITQPGERVFDEKKRTENLDDLLISGSRTNSRAILPAVDMEIAGGWDQNHQVTGHKTKTMGLETCIPYDVKLLFNNKIKFGIFDTLQYGIVAQGYFNQKLTEGSKVLRDQGMESHAYIEALLGHSFSKNLAVFGGLTGNFYYYKLNTPFDTAEFGPQLSPGVMGKMYVFGKSVNGKPWFIGELGAHYVLPTEVKSKDSDGETDKTVTTLSALDTWIKAQFNPAGGKYGSPELFFVYQKPFVSGGNKSLGVEVIKVGLGYSKDLGNGWSIGAEGMYTPKRYQENSSEDSWAAKLRVSKKVF